MKEIIVLVCEIAGRPGASRRELLSRVPPSATLQTTTHNRKVGVTTATIQEHGEGRSGSVVMETSTPIEGLMGRGVERGLDTERWGRDGEREEEGERHREDRKSTRLNSSH